MARPSESSTHIPSFAKPLSPYVKPQEDVLRIRQALTVYLRSLVVYDDTDASQDSYLALCAPTYAVADVKRTPADLLGMRKEYLQALQANVAARKDLQKASEDVQLLRRQRLARNRPAEPTEAQDPGAELRDYLLLLRDRRRHNKLQVFQHYLEDIRARKPADIEIPEDSLSPDLRSEGFDLDTPDRTGSEADLEGLVHKLERAVVRARSQLDQEKRLFEELKSRHEAGNASMQESSSLSRAKALKRTRDELVHWVEERLVAEGDPDDSLVQELPPEEIEEAQRLLEQYRQRIREQYAIYVQARQDLLNRAAKACQPVILTTKPSYRSANRSDIVPEEVPPPNPWDVLSYANEVLVPLSKSHKSLALQKSYLSALLGKEKSTTLRALNRLSDESHLLPEYPILARQPRFKNAPQGPETGSLDEVVRLAEAWSFASDAAATSQREYVQQKVGLGIEVSRDARTLLEEVYKTLNQDLRSALESGPEQQATSDIWASEAKSTRGANLSGSRLEKRPKGPWSGLNGRVGVE
ncbi:hypothetical protein N7468_006016 [Penicillium chermesinum]|uniref:Uncharacterized protein n=1 Tax=Penicillium chermesinum TaxID=63820 RepID=A0A9W9P0I6_9EURO|nr:uncharacterized protein N7468_006016 [Penicillium chermesinum]KAJ5233060.1 hypothetical protein N7468_006016 [Penicillium chermesinum]KAJ6172699.1 hypothetical protein N7470_001766 [Penicillium chermesinum]